MQPILTAFQESQLNRESQFLAKALFRLCCRTLKTFWNIRSGHHKEARAQKSELRSYVPSSSAVFSFESFASRTPGWRPTCESSLTLLYNSCVCVSDLDETAGVQSGSQSGDPWLGLRHGQSCLLQNAAQRHLRFHPARRRCGASLKSLCRVAMRQSSEHPRDK